MWFFDYCLFCGSLVVDVVVQEVCIVVCGLQLQGCCVVDFVVVDVIDNYGLVGWQFGGLGVDFGWIGLVCVGDY